jgi:hypothetical protein
LKVSDPVEDRLLEDYLHRKSALSMGYKKVYVEAPPEELDRAVKARAKRALRWLIPGTLSLLIGLSLVFGVNYGVYNWLNAAKQAEKAMEQRRAERRRLQQQQERERIERGEEPIMIITPTEPPPSQSNPTPLTREQWLNKIDALRRAGKSAEAEAEWQQFQQQHSGKR